MTFFKFCKKCEKRFKPTGKYEEYCASCRTELRMKGRKNKLEKIIILPS
jgi:hypothetical protein